VTLEAWARGKIVVSTLTQGAKYIFNAEVPRETPWGIVVRKDATEIAEAINSILTNESKKRRMEEEAYKKAREFTWKETARKTIDLYKTHSLTHRDENDLV
jgi:glycosyltransferase involved in cell wall biosynthesis